MNVGTERDSGEDVSMAVKPRAVETVYAPGHLGIQAAVSILLRSVGL